MATVKNPVRWVALAVVALVLVLSVVFGTQLGNDPSAVRSVTVGKQMKPFEVGLVGGGTIGSKDLVGRPYVINVWASWCTPCRKEHGALRAFHEKYRDKGVELIGVLYNDTASGAKAYMKELGGDWLIATDPKYRLINDLGATGPPETYVIDQDGVITVKFTGAVNLAVLEEAMAQIGLS